MRKLLLFIIVGMTCYIHTAQAGLAEVRESARQNNCAPKKIQIYQQQLGTNPLTTYRVDCIEPKTVGENLPKMPSAMLIEGETSICRLLRPITDQQP